MVNDRCWDGGAARAGKGRKAKMFEHGGDWAGYLEQAGQRPLDFSANLSPLGLPAGVKAALVAAMEGEPAYPDPFCRELRAKLAEHHGVRPEQILCGSGASDLFFRLALALKPRKALVVAPAFSEYETSLAQAGCEVCKHVLGEQNGFVADEGLLDAVTEDIDVVYICEPSNPAGQVTPPVLLDRLLARCSEAGALLAVDECFLDFLPDGGERSLACRLADGNLIVFKAFTKFFAMAGLRLGYCLSADTALLEAMRKAGQPWAVSTFAQAAGVAALDECDYGDKLRALIGKERDYLSHNLDALGCRVIPGRADYLLFRCEDAALDAKLRERGILIRNCSNYDGLGPGWFRVAVKRRADNERLIKAMGEALPDVFSGVVGRVRR